jgi:hypothetical protein
LDKKKKKIMSALPCYKKERKRRAINKEERKKRLKK